MVSGVDIFSEFLHISVQLLPLDNSMPAFFSIHTNQHNTGAWDVSYLD